MILEVYKITNIKNGKIYVGITNQGVGARWVKHCSDSRHGSSFPIHNAIRKHGEENFQIEVIETVEDVEYLKEREVYWIKHFNSYNREKGYNLTFGGDGTFGRYHSDETKEKIRQKALGRTVDEDVKIRMSTSHKNRIYDYKEMSDRAKKGNLVRWSDKGNKEKQSLLNTNNKPVLQYSVEGVLLKEYYNISEAGRSVGKRPQNIGKCASGKLKTAYNFVWKFKN